MTEHWLPYEERRLYRLLGIDRGDLWRFLRDNRRTIAELVSSKGWHRDALVAPWRGKTSPRRVGALRSRALRTLTQGYLAQHTFFHPFHQTSVPRRARAIFGVPR